MAEIERWFPFKGGRLTDRNGNIIKVQGVSEGMVRYADHLAALKAQSIEHQKELRQAFDAGIAWKLYHPLNSYRWAADESFAVFLASLSGEAKPEECEWRKDRIWWRTMCGRKLWLYSNPSGNCLCGKKIKEVQPEGEKK